MPSTTNFGWTTPADTDLVKDGANAIRTLANGIDTSLVDLKGGTTGQVLSKTSNTDMDFTWVTRDGDIEGVTPGTGISGGGTTGTVTITNSMATAIDAKGDLIAGTGDDAFSRLASSGTNGSLLAVQPATATGLAWVTPGSNGENLVADSTTSTGLRWTNNWNVGKNKCINGDFSINQRGFTSATASGSYGFDRWRITAVNGTTTYSTQAFTLGTAPVAGYEGTNFARLVTTGQTLASAVSTLEQRIESVRTFANQTVTISFWAKANTGTPKIAVELNQNFGTGGTPSAEVNTNAGQVTLSTSWARYSVTVAVPSIAGKTLGTTAGTNYLEVRLYVSAGTDFNARTGSLGIQSNTFDIWGVQAESGSVATAFTLNSGSPQAELAACQRYYFRQSGLAVNDVFGNGQTITASTSTFIINFPVEMRVAPTALEQTGTPANYQTRQTATVTGQIANPTFLRASRYSGVIQITNANNPFTTQSPIYLEAASTAAIFGWTGAEL